MNEVLEKIRRICSRLADEPSDSEQALRYRAELRTAGEEFAAQEKLWNKASEFDQSGQHQDGARQSYRSREADSADGFANGLKLFKARTQDTDKKKD